MLPAEEGDVGHPVPRRAARSARGERAQAPDDQPEEPRSARGADAPTDGRLTKVIINVAPLLKQAVGEQASYQIVEDPIDARGDNAGLREAGARSIDASITATHTNPGAYLEGDADARVEVE